MSATPNDRPNFGETVLDYYKNLVEPALYRNLGTAFPEFGWKRHGDSYVAEGTGNDHLGFLSALTGGQGPRAGDRVQCYQSSPGAFTIHGTRTVSWTSYVAGTPGTSPRGKDFEKAVYALADKAGVAYPSKSLRPTLRTKVNAEELTTYRNRLLKNPTALEWFTKTRGFDRALIDNYMIGFDEKGTKIAAKILRFPIMGPTGEPTASRSGFYLIPGLSAPHKPNAPSGWAYGKPPGVFYAWPQANQDKILIVEGPKDLWALATLIGNDLEFKAEWLLVTGTSGTALPPEFKDPNFYLPFRAMYLGLDGDDAGQRAVDTIIGAKGISSMKIDIRIPRVDSRFASKAGKRADWNDLLLSGGTKEDFMGALAAAQHRTVDVSSSATDEKEVDIQTVFHNGSLYFSTERHAVKRDPTDPKRITHEEMETVVLKSTGEILVPRVSPSITPGVRRADRFNETGRRAILRLNDGTMISKYPKPIEGVTWRQKSWQDFSAARLAGKKPICPELKALVQLIHHQFRSAVWLPRPQDYALLTLAVVASYAQEIFDAVPMFLCVGAPGTGKSELGDTAASMGCNASSLPKATASSFARTCDARRGLTVVDDFEEVRGRVNSNGDAQFDDIHQLIKICYKKNTGFRVITEDNGASIKHVIYGVKLINNTKGVDPIVASRMFKIPTCKMPEDALVELKRLREEALDAEGLRRLKDDLHTWVFSNVALIDERYRLLMSDKINRHDEIAAPLVTLAGLAGNEDIIRDLNDCLARRVATPAEGDLEAARAEAFNTIVRKGFEHVSTAHFINELNRLLPQNFGKSHVNEIPEHAQPHSAGKWLSNQAWFDEHVKPVRILTAENSRIRAYKIDDGVLEQTKELVRKRGELVEARKSPGEFCERCEGCEFRSNCSILNGRQGK